MRRFLDGMCSAPLSDCRSEGVYITMFIAYAVGLVAPTLYVPVLRFANGLVNNHVLNTC